MAGGFRGGANDATATAPRWRYSPTMTAIQRKIVFDEHGAPLEVIIPWEQFCELSEALGLDLEAKTIANLREAKHDWESGNHAAFIPLSDL